MAHKGGIDLKTRESVVALFWIITWKILGTEKRPVYLSRVNSRKVLEIIGIEVKELVR